MEVFLIKLVSHSPEETFALGRRAAAFLVPGSVLALKGTLGSGKTCFTKGIASGLGIKEIITSPTYTIISEYQCDNSLILYHIDAYRLAGDRDFEDLGGKEIICGEGISVIEWSENIPGSIPHDAITIYLEILGPSSRIIQIDGLELQ